MNSKQQIFFIKRLSFLIKADVGVLESLTMIRDQTRSKHMIKILDKILSDISNGQFLSTSLATFKNMLSDFAIHIIQFGELSGTLSENLEYLASEMNKRRILTRKITAAFAYPVIVTVATFGITAFLMMYLFPKIMPVFKSLHMQLPWSTRVVIGLSTFICTDGYYALACIALLCAICIFAFKKNVQVRLHIDQICLRLPLVGNVLRQFNLANITRTLGLLLKSGTTLSDALPIASKTTQNSVYKKELSLLSPIIDRGEKMSVHLLSSRTLFPDVFTQIIEVGERSGNLSHSFLYLSTLYEEEVDEFTKNLSSLVEPILMITMGVLVGFIAISIITPIYGITQNLHS